MLLHQRIERVNIAVRIGTLRRRVFVSDVERGIIVSVVRLYGKKQATIVRETFSSPSYEGIVGGPRDRMFSMSRGEAATYFTGMDRLVEATECTRARGLYGR